MKNFRKLLCTVLAITLLLCIPSFSYAAEQVTDTGYRYIADSAKKTAQIIGYTGTAHVLTIPDKIDGYTVTSIKSDAFKDCKTILSVTIPDTVTTIGSECFCGCTLLGTINLGKGVSSVGSKAFSGCTALTAVSVPAAVTVIGDNAFFDCPLLPRIEVSTDNVSYKSVDGILYNKAGTRMIVYPAAHAGTSYNVPSGVTQIDDYAFYASKALKVVSLPSSVSSVGKAVFKNCSALTQASLAADMKIKKIEDEFFSGCKKLSALSIPSAVTAIGDKAFYGCAAIPLLAIPDTVTTVGSAAFANCSGMKSVTIGKGVTAVSGSAFTGCTALTEYKLASGASYSVDDGVLFNKDGTRLIAYPAGKAAESYTVGDKVTTIGANAFDSCKNLKKLNIPASVKTIVKPAVTNCTATVIYADKDSEAYKYFKANTDGYASLNNEGAAKPGDVNGDDAVDNADVILVRRYVAKWKNVKVNTEAADVNADDTVDNADVILLRRYVAGWKNITLK